MVQIIVGSVCGAAEYLLLTRLLAALFTKSKAALLALTTAKLALMAATLIFSAMLWPDKLALVGLGAAGAITALCGCLLYCKDS